MSNDTTTGNASRETACLVQEQDQNREEALTVVPALSRELSLEAIDQQVGQGESETMIQVAMQIEERLLMVEQIDLLMS